MLKKEDPDNRISNRILAMARNRDQEMATKKEADPKEADFKEIDFTEISPISVIHIKKEKEKPAVPKLSTEEVLKNLEQNYQPVQDFFTMVDNFFFDTISSNLTASSQAVYLQLYRLSHGWNRPYCKVGKKTLTDRTNISKNTIVKSIKELKEKNYIKEIAWDQDGTIFQILLPREIIGGSNSGIQYNTIPKIGIPESSGGSIFGIPKIGIPKIGIPDQVNNNNDSSPIQCDSIPKIGIPKIGIPDQVNNNNDSSPIQCDSIPKIGIPKIGIPESSGGSNFGIQYNTIPKIGIPESSGGSNFGIPKIGIPKQIAQNLNFQGMDSGSIPKFDPIKYNIYKNTLSKKSPPYHEEKNIPSPSPPPEKEISEKNITEKEIVDNFYQILNQAVSSDQKKSGYKKVKDLLKDGYSILDVKFAAEWVAKNESGAQSFNLVSHRIGQILKEQKQILIDKQKQEEERKEREELERQEREELERQRKLLDEGKDLDEYYDKLEDTEKNVLKSEAVDILSSVDPQFNNKNLGFMKDFLIKIKIRELVRKNFFV